MTASRARRPTITDIATAAGVSVQTVSRVLNDRPDVSFETSKRVQAIIDEVGYSPSVVARSLARGRSWMLGVVTSALDLVGPSQILTGIEGRARELGYAISLDLIRDPAADEVAAIIASLEARRVDGIIWAIPPVVGDRPRTDDTAALVAVPGVQVGGPDTGIALPSISIDNQQIGRIATGHLLDTGSTRVGIVTGPAHSWEARERTAGWLDAHRVRGLEPADALVVEGDWTPESGRRGLERLIERVPSLDGVFAANDQMAAGVLHAAHVRGLRLPADLAVIGVDDIAEASHYWPPLSTVRQPLREAGALAVEAIHLALGPLDPWTVPVGDPVHPSPIRLEPELIIRESTRRRPH
jgi:DNA-binding LacI/PurR family transcriptional regulator